MILSDADIASAVSDGKIIVTPAPPAENYSPSAVDLRIGHDFKRWKRLQPGLELTFRLSEVDMPSYRDQIEDVAPGQDGCVVIGPGDFFLSRTLERVELPLKSRLAARVEGRSSYARLGLSIHMTAPVIHAGFSGPIVLEMKNHGSFFLKLDPGKTCICQLVFEQLSSEPRSALRSAFVNQASVLGGQDGGR